MNTEGKSKSRARRRKKLAREGYRRRSSSGKFSEVASTSGLRQDHAQTGMRSRHVPARSGQTRHTHQIPSAQSLQTGGESVTEPSSTSQHSDCVGSDTPGYYYDAETKLYFKIQSYNLSSVGPFVTKDKIVSKQREHQRMVDIQNLGSQKPPSSVSAHTSGVSTQRQKNHIINILGHVQSGQVTCENMRMYMIRHVCSRIQPDTKWNNSLPGQPSLHLGEIQKMEVNKRRSKMACVSSLRSSYSQIIQLISIDEQRLNPSEHRRTSLSITVPDLAHGPIHKRIKTMCWAPMKGRPGQPIVLYTTVCPIGCLASIAYLCNLQAQNDEEQILFELNLGKSIIWSSSWKSHGHQFTIGAERKCYLIDVVTRKQWTFNTFDSDALSQLISPSSQHIYNGIRKGHILLHDMRTPDWARHTFMMKQAPGVGCLRLLRDENYLMASDFSGIICTWDQRMRRKVMEYKGLMNSHWQLPFHVDETESLLTSTGSDSYTKIWDMKNGEVLCSIPPPYPASSDSFPLSFYSSRWANRDGNSALLVAMRNSFRFYTYKET